VGRKTRQPPDVALAGGTAGLLTVVVLSLALATTAAAAQRTQSVLVVGNNWDGTADVVDPRTFRRLIRLNIVPDRDERMAEIMADPAALGFFTGIRQLIGEGHDQFVDDAFTPHDGRYLHVSRPSFKDVVAIDLATRKIAWRFQVDGYRSDHMAISPDGRTVPASASTGNVVHAIDTATGKEAWRFPSGDSPHENNFSEDGTNGLGRCAKVAVTGCASGPSTRRGTRRSGRPCGAASRARRSALPQLS
jgi:outer membrane protein assembly factor BamB